MSKVQSHKSEAEMKGQSKDQGEGRRNLDPLCALPVLCGENLMMPFMRRMDLWMNILT